jgi:hypothetical protein
MAKSLPITINDIYIRDHNTGLLTKMDTYNNKAKLTVNGADCICDNMLEEVTFNFITDPDTFLIKAIDLDIVLGSNLKGKCSDRLYLTRSTSIQWLGSLKVSIN